MRFLALLAAAGVAAAVSQPASARDPFVLEPSSKWVVDYDDDSCALRRAFGEGEQRAHIEIRKFQPGAALQVMIGSNVSRTRKRAFRYRFEPGGKWHDDDGNLFLRFGEGFAGTLVQTGLIERTGDGAKASEDMGPAELTASMIADELEAADNVTGFTIDRLFGRRLHLDTGSLRTPFEALHRCLDELVTHWGIDIEAHKSLTRRPHPKDPGRMSRMIDYPPAMLAKLMPGFVNLRLDVSEHGDVTACHIQMPLSDPSFERSSCDTLRRHLKFDPALDKDGKPIASYWVTSVRFYVG